MRSDMAKVVTEAPRRGHANRSRKWGRRLRNDEYDHDDHGPTRASSARYRQYGYNCKEFSDLLGPLQRYLRGQVGRPWAKIWSEITQTLDSRSLTGQHILDHIRWEVELHAWLGDDGRVYGRRRFGSVESVVGLYVHPVTRILRRAPGAGVRYGTTEFAQAQAAIGAFGVTAASAGEIGRYRIEGTRLWERRNCGWFIHTYYQAPIQMTTRSDGTEVPVYPLPRLQRIATKQASKKEIRDALPLLRRAPLA